MNNATPPTNKSSPSGGGQRRHNNEKGVYEWLIFAAAVATGTACSVLSKILYETTDAQGRRFDKPIAQTLAMFVAMIFGLPLHWIVIYFQIPFSGYDRFYQSKSTSLSTEGCMLDDWNGDSENGMPLLVDNVDCTPKIRHHKASNRDEEMQNLLAPPCSEPNYHDDTRIPIKTYFYLMIPALFDCVATVLCMIGLLFLDVSIYQLLRGSGIIFVALLRQYYLHEHLFYFQWTGVAWNVASVMLVGTTALLNSSHAYEDSNAEQATIGVLFMLAGSLVQSMMFVFEEKVMNVDEVGNNPKQARKIRAAVSNSNRWIYRVQVKVPPLLLFGMEGLW